MSQQKPKNATNKRQELMKTLDKLMEEFQDIQPKQVKLSDKHNYMVSEIACGYRHSVVRVSNGHSYMVYAFGDNSSGQIEASKGNTVD